MIAFTRMTRATAVVRACAAVAAFVAFVAFGAFAAVTPAQADGAWCASVSGPEGGYVSCSYVSWEQCQATLSGLGGICFARPQSALPAPTEPRPRRHG